MGVEKKTPPFQAGIFLVRQLLCMRFDPSSRDISFQRLGFGHDYEFQFSSLTK